ncbi:hypothetical protein C8R47DRAFT_1321891 [Mycena vitilis]|nr:hypothetical protein C8R47DRAFT_1321891 [Mycena vitilis]
MSSPLSMYPPPPPPRKAIFSGYTMGLSYFQELVLAINADFATPIEVYVCAYDNWQRRLPEDDLVKAPIVKVYDLKENDPTPTKFLFPTRAVPAPDDLVPELSQPALETDLDKSRRDELIDLIKRRHNFSVQKFEHLRFEAIPDVHPYYSALGI